MPSKLLEVSNGISKSILDQINLQDIDVIQGKKYIGSDGKIHTGSLKDQPNDLQCPVVTQYEASTGFTYLAVPVGAYRKSDGRMSPHPNIKRKLIEIVREAGFDRGQYQYAGGIGSAIDEHGRYYALNNIPEGFYSKNGAEWAPEIRISEETYLGFVPGGNRGAWGTTINPGGSVTIPQGYHNGGGVVWASAGSFSGYNSGNGSAGSVGQFFSEGDHYSTKATGTTTVSLSGRRITVHTRIDMYGTYQAVWNQSFTDKHLSAVDYDVILDF